ncbi:Do family serine endopeptidase [Halorhodospira abdelmalekii]|uniref:Do family serine endopeptidase n=1 Tax=Halorhodospira abdelmalekii TaxID=421629 RepID=UPI001F5B67A9|nr:Do family serine endopeptidase [Halorhodospira abdelmalekii]
MTTKALLCVSFWLFLPATLIAETAVTVKLPNFVDLVREHSAAVVNISTHRELAGFGLGFPGGFAEEGQSLGSGFIIAGDGLVLTNDHVTAQADGIIVRLADGRELEAEVVGTDEHTDLALLKVEAEGLPTVSIGSAEALQVGEWVLAIGSPFGFEHSVTAGIVSAKGRALPHGNYVPYIQTDVAINPGNSGGPLFNLDGEVVGINAQIYSRTGGFMGLSFAIPIELAMDVAEQLQRTGRVERGWLGVVIQDVARDLAAGLGLERPRGALVVDLLEEGPAAAAGVRSGDVILEFAGQRIDASATLPPLVGRAEIGSTVELKVLRDAEVKSLEIEIATLPPDERPLAVALGAAPSGPQHSSVFGVRVVPLDQGLRRQFGLDDEEGGVVVTEVTGEAMRAAGVQVGDVLLSLAQEPLDSVESLDEIAAQLSSGSTVPLRVVRQGKMSFLAVQVP